MRRHGVSIPVAIFAGVLVTAGTASAHLDPEPTSYILQAIAALAVGGGFVVKATWRRIARFVGRMFGKDNPTEKPGRPAPAARPRPSRGSVRARRDVRRSRPRVRRTNRTVDG